MKVDDVVDTIRRGIRCPIGLEAVWGMDRLTGKGAERKGTAVSVMEIKEALGKLSPAELAEVSAFIEGREADWLEQCGRTADERLRVKSWKVRTAAACVEAALPKWGRLSDWAGASAMMRPTGD